MTDLFGITTKKEVVNWIKENYNVEPLLLGITGSHMWNLATKDSDLDIRGVYLKPTEKTLSIYTGKDTIERISAVNNKDVDIQLYELKKTLKMLLSDNGNIIELLLSPYVFYKDKNINWRDIAKKSISKKLANYYKGYAHSQRKRAAKNRGGKSLTYAYREIMAGTWLMRTGKIIYNFKKLKKDFERFYGFSSTLLDWSMNNKEKGITDDVWEGKFKKDWDKLIAIFEDELSKSELPEDVSNISEFNNILLEKRLSNLQ